MFYVSILVCCFYFSPNTGSTRKFSVKKEVLYCSGDAAQAGP